MHLGTLPKEAYLLDSPQSRSKPPRRQQHPLHDHRTFQATPHPQRCVPTLPAPTSTPPSSPRRPTSKGIRLVSHDPITAFLTALVTFSPSLLDDGIVEMTPVTPPPPAILPDARLPAAHAPNQLFRLRANPTGHAAEPTDLAWFLALPSATAVRFEP